MKVLLIGGTSLVGPHVIRELVLQGFDVATVTRTGRNYFCENVFTADREDRRALKNIIQKFSPDCLIDMIPFTAGQARILSAVVAEIAPKLPVIALSSIDIYAAYARLQRTEDVDYQNCPISEDMALRAKMGVEGEAYDKLNVERIYKEAFPNLTILRLPALYGWPDTTRIENYLEPMLAGNSEIRMSKERAGWKFSRCLHKNAAFAISQCVLAGEGHYIYNVAEEPVYTDLEWCRKIAALCGWRGEILIEAAENEADFKQDFYVSSQKIRAERGFFEKYSPDEGLADTIAFYAYQRLGKRYTKYY